MIIAMSRRLARASPPPLGSDGSRVCRECSEYLLTGRLGNPRIYMPARLENVHTPRPQGVLDAGDDMRVAVDVVRLAEHGHQLPESAEGGGVE